ncbi:MAG TPA: glycosyltransferase N-terminal domain-containing protein [Acidobacteriota bacterium]|nr:glycosyltransferase N-terminal domain-containing protein [Acidobacteriota bacterium]
MSPALALYRALTGAAGLVAAPLGAALAPEGSPWRERMGRVAGAHRAAGGPWVHAASLGEALAARRWVEALLGAGHRPPLLVTTRTRTGRERVTRELGARAIAAIAPLDFPRAIRTLLREACPSRLDLIETELWPNLLYEARRAGLPVVAVSATVSERTASRLRRLGLAGPGLFGALHVLAQSERHAERFVSLGVPRERTRVIGDLKADAPSSAAAGSGPAPAASPAPVPADARRLVLFASLRPGEEEVAAAVARTLRRRGAEEAWRFVVAPRHDEGGRAAARALAAAGFEIRRRTAAAGPAVAGTEGAADSAIAWSREIGAVAGGRVGLLETRGELPSLFPAARVALVGGTFSRHGGHNVLEPASAGAPVVVGPNHGDVEAGVAALLRHGAVAIAADADAAARAVDAWLVDSGAVRQAGALAAAREAEGAARRALEALASWGLVP